VFGSYIGKMEDLSILKNFSLTRDEYNSLVVLQASKADFWMSFFKEDKELVKLMREWLNEWILLLHDGKLISFKDVPTKKEVSAAIDKIDKMPILKAHIILFEAYIFEPFFPLGKRSVDGLVKKTQVSAAKDGTKAHLLKLFQDSNIKTNIFKTVEKDFEEGIVKFRPSRLFERVAIGAVAAALVGITAGLAAPAIGAAIGGLMGLSGAAATSAGLAFLGGGALAAGGFGMFGGTVAVIGGGALFGGAIGSNAFALLSSPKLFVRELSKLFVILKRFAPLLGKDLYESTIEEVNNGLRKFRNELKEEISRNESAALDESSKQKISSLKETLECLEKFRVWIQEV
jgi:hypothetical protein